MDRDILIIDTPPGTSDEHITVMENLRSVLPKVDGAILVTTPQVNSQSGASDFWGAATFFRMTHYKHLKLIITA